MVNQASGVYTQLPEAADKVGCGGVLYRVDNRPVVLLCGTIPAYLQPTPVPNRHFTVNRSSPSPRSITT